MMQLQWAATLTDKDGSLLV